jgi:hypothetical protein
MSNVKTWHFCSVVECHVITYNKLIGFCNKFIIIIIIIIIIN